MLDDSFVVLLNVYYDSDNPQDFPFYEVSKNIDSALHAAGFDGESYPDSDDDENGNWVNYIRVYCHKLFSNEDIQRALDIMQNEIINAGGRVTYTEYVIDG